MNLLALSFTVLVPAILAAGPEQSFCVPVPASCRALAAPSAKACSSIICKSTFDSLIFRQETSDLQTSAKQKIPYITCQPSRSTETRTATFTPPTVTITQTLKASTATRTVVVTTSQRSK